MGVKKTTSEFISDAKKIHNNRYDYNNVSYKNNKTKILIKCNNCGNNFFQTPKNHLVGQGCPFCKKETVSKKLADSREEFIEKAKKIHNNRYDYSNVNYVNSITKVLIKCNNCGREMSVVPFKHLSNENNCDCYKRKSTGGNSTKKLSTSEFIEKAKKIHNNRYDYNNVSYKNNKTKILIKCNNCGNNFFQTPKSHLAGQGCPKCSRSKSIEQFISDAKKVHNNCYDYSNVIYKNSQTKILIKCNNCGYSFLQKPYAHLQGQGCPKCAGNLTYTTDTWTEKAKLVHNNRYDYSNVNYIDCDTKVKIICKKHGEFLQSPTNHLSGNGCPVCNESKGEKTIRNYLVENNIDFVPQKKFPDCKDKNQLSYDFYIPSRNLLIEYNGEQHYRPYYDRSTESLKLQRHHDWLKRDYAKKNGYNLLVVKFSENVLKKLSDCLTKPTV